MILNAGSKTVARYNAQLPWGLSDIMSKTVEKLLIFLFGCMIYCTEMSRVEIREDSAELNAL